MLVSYHPDQRYTDTPAVGPNYYFDPWQTHCADGRMKITVVVFDAGQNDVAPSYILRGSLLVLPRIQLTDPIHPRFGGTQGRQ